MYARQGSEKEMTSNENARASEERIRFLIENRSFRKESVNDPDVRGALSMMEQLAGVGYSREQRLAAISLLSKARETSKPIGRIISEIFTRITDNPFPHTSEWGNAESRFYVAKAVQKAHASWVGEYAAHELATADINEQLSRPIWAEIAVSGSDNLAATIKLISDGLGSNLSGMSGIRRNRALTKILEALEVPILTTESPLGDRLGQSLSSLISNASADEDAEARKVRAQLAETTLRFIIQLIRLRFTLLFDSDIYRVCGRVRNWWKPARPPQAVEDYLDRIALLAMDGLRILVRQGARDDELRRALSVSLGQERVDVIGRRLSQSDPTLEPGLSSWLATGRYSPGGQINDGARELSESGTDELIAQLLLAVESPPSSEALRSVADAIEMLEPMHAAELITAAHRDAVIRQWAGALAAKRRLRIDGARGSILGYDPSVHDAPEAIQRMTKVRIKVPAVIKTDPSGRSSIIIKSLVSTAE